MLENLTIHDNAVVGSGTIVNQLLYVYNTFNLLTTEYQSHPGRLSPAHAKSAVFLR